MQLVKKESDPIKLAARYLKTELSTILHCLTRLVSELIKCHFGVNRDATLHAFAHSLNLSFLLRYFEQLMTVQQQAKIALNQQLLLEDLFCSWSLQKIVNPKLGN